MKLKSNHASFAVVAGVVFMPRINGGRNVLGYDYGVLISHFRIMRGDSQGWYVTKIPTNAFEQCDEAIRFVHVSAADNGSVCILTAERLKDETETVNVRYLKPSEYRLCVHYDGVFYRENSNGEIRIVNPKDFSIYQISND